MNGREVIRCLREDVEEIELPPVSEKVLQAMSEQRQKYIEYVNNKKALKKQRYCRIRRYVFAAMLALLAVCVSNVVMKNQVPVSDLTKSSVFPSLNETTEGSESRSATSTEGSETPLEHIRLKRSCGEVALSGKSEEELEMLLETYSKDNSVYEDDKYIYSFDSHGRLIEMRKTAFGDEDGPPVDEREIKAKVNALLKEYYPDWLESGSDIMIEKNEDGRPAWTVDVVRNNDDYTKDTIYITFEKSGNLMAIICSENEENVGVISKADSVQTALEEAKSGKYPVSDFDNKDVDISVEIKKKDNKAYYNVIIGKIPLNESVFMGLCVSVDAQTGEILSVKQ